MCVASAILSVCNPFESVATSSYHNLRKTCKPESDVTKDLCRLNETRALEVADADICELKAFLFTLALLRSIVRQRNPLAPLLAAFVWLLKLLAAPFAWGESILSVLGNYDNESGAGASDMMSYIATPFLLNLKDLPDELLEAFQGVRCFLKDAAVI